MTDEWRQAQRAEMAQQARGAPGKYQRRDGRRLFRRRTRARLRTQLRLLLALALAPGVLQAAPCEATAEIAEGQVAPCDGVLWPVATMRRAARCWRITVPTLQAELDRARADAATDKALTQQEAAADLAVVRAEAAADLELARAEGASKLKACEAEGEAARTALDQVVQAAVAAPAEPTPVPWYERPAVTWPTGIGVGAAIVTGIWAVAQ